MTSEDEATADGIRYAVLRRLAPGIRHSLMGELQAIQFLAELAARQLQASTDPAKVADGLSHIIAQTRSTVGSCRSIVEWLRPDAGATTAVGEGVAQCLKLAGDDWPLRGVEATTKLQATDVLVDKAALRELLTASLIALTDMHPGTLDIDVQSAADGDDVELKLHARAADRRSSLPPAEHERRFTWADVQMLAKVHGVSCSCQAHGTILRLRRTAAADG
ncbi:MAG TPA: hypothetical protein VGK75_15540 [Casimicrobiaceae bacterium]